MNLSDNYNGNFWLTVLVAICIIAAVYTGLLYIGFLYHSSAFFSLSFEEMLRYKDSFESKLIFTLFSLIQFGTLLLIGYYVGSKAYRFSWLYGGIVGAIWMIMFFIATIFFTLFAVDYYTIHYRSLNPSTLQSQYQHLSLVFINLPVMLLKTAGITALGGASSALIKRKFKNQASY